MSHRFLMAGFALLMHSSVALAGMLPSPDAGLGGRIIASYDKSLYAPGSSRAALQMASEDGYGWIEVSVWRARGQEHFIATEEQVKTLCGGAESARKKSLSAICQMDSGSLFSERVAGEKILSLTDAFRLQGERLNLCLNCRDVDAESLLRQIHRCGKASRVILSGDLGALKAISEKTGGKVALMPFWDPFVPIHEIKEFFTPFAVRMKPVDVSSEAVEALKSQGIAAVADLTGIRESDIWTKCLESKADLFISDTPEDLWAHLFTQLNMPRPSKFSLHRGALRYAPENTPSAFEKALHLKADYIEFDVRHCASGEYFLLHDSKVNRTTDGKGVLSELGLDKVASLDAGGWFGKPFMGTRLPAYEDFLKLAKGMDIGLYYDAKDITPQALVSSLAEHGLLERTVVYQSADYLAEVKKLSPEIHLMPPLGDIADIEKLASELKPYAVDAAWDSLSKELIDKCHHHGIQVFSDESGPNLPVENYTRVMDWGIDLIQTDHPMMIYRAYEAISQRNQ